MTFRRSSTTPIGQTSHPPPEGDPHGGDDHGNAAAPEPSLSRYSKEQLVSLYSAPKASDDSERIFYPGWNPHSNGTNGNSARGWGKQDTATIPQEPGACWDADRTSAPLALRGMTEEEQEVRLLISP